jgi:hypothetical protein
LSLSWSLPDSGSFCFPAVLGRSPSFFEVIAWEMKVGDKR